MDDERPRYAVYPVVGDQCQFDEELHVGNDKIVASLAAKRAAKAHPLGVILLDWRIGDSWVWREHPRLNGHPVTIRVHTGDLERWVKEITRRNRQ